MNNNFDLNKLGEQIIRSSKGRINSSDLERLRKGDISSLFGSLSEKDRENLTRALKDKSVADKILGSKEAQDILKKFKKGNRTDG